MQHDWGPSTLNHGEAQCRRCLMTNREAMVLGDECPAPQARPANDDRADAPSRDPEIDMDPDTERCWNCGGIGKIAGCFEDCCACGAEDDAELCCAPSRCDVCHGKGRFDPPSA